MRSPKRRIAVSPLSYASVSKNFFSVNPAARRTVSRKVSIGRSWVPEGVLTACATNKRKLLDPISTAATRSEEFNAESAVK